MFPMPLSLRCNNFLVLNKIFYLDVSRVVALDFCAKFALSMLLFTNCCNSGACYSTLHIFYSLGSFDLNIGVYR